MAKQMTVELVRFQYSPERLFIRLSLVSTEREGSSVAGRIIRERRPSIDFYYSRKTNTVEVSPETLKRIKIQGNELNQDECNLATEVVHRELTSRGFSYTTSASGDLAASMVLDELVKMEAPDKSE